MELSQRRSTACSSPSLLANTLAGALTLSFQREGNAIEHSLCPSNSPMRVEELLATWASSCCPCWSDALHDSRLSPTHGAPESRTAAKNGKYVNRLDRDFLLAIGCAVRLVGEFQLYHVAQEKSWGKSRPQVDSATAVSQKYEGDIMQCTYSSSS